MGTQSQEQEEQQLLRVWFVKTSFHLKLWLLCSLITVLLFSVVFTPKPCRAVISDGQRDTQAQNRVQGSVWLTGWDGGTPSTYQRIAINSLKPHLLVIDGTSGRDMKTEAPSTENRLHWSSNMHFQQDWLGNWSFLLLHCILCQAEKTSVLKNSVTC